ncbi:hypothetical protein GCG21_13230 [Pseudactinotalea sp. HY160]|uniref:hypothetical protein n=1 Tax=Pseudactinotalea sp. HY160 TaxID=2654490 RepID=UPI00128AE0C6|nr:hypothetical protein [Pseudactinotalea sp. HY160]MPV50954.1 hypothetical protein [Pseudactinotalea sp. HY160]
MTAIDFSAMARGAELLGQQADHGRAVEDYLRREAGPGAGGGGPLLAAARARLGAATELGARGARLSTMISNGTALSLSQSVREYVRVEQDLHATLNRLLARFDSPATPWEDPSAPAAAGPAVVAAADPRSHLTPPHRGAHDGDESDGTDDLRRDAARLLGGIDWVARGVLGFSILEDVVRAPLAGDWSEVGADVAAWAHGADAMRAIGANYASLAASDRSWGGAAGQAFRARVSTAGSAHEGLGAGYDAVAGYAAAVSIACRYACAGIGLLLTRLTAALLDLAIEATDPAGWSALGPSAHETMNTVVRGVRLAYALIDAVLDAITAVVGGTVHLHDVVDALEGLAESAGGAGRGESE